MISVPKFWDVVYALSKDWEPILPQGVLNLKSPTLRVLIARAIRNERRERGAMIVRRYSRDPVVDRRERKLAQQKAEARGLMRLAVSR